MESRIIKILAIDDNKDNLISVKALIKETFPEAIFLSATDGQRGIELAAAEDPDVILLDIVMPGMDGFEVCKRMKADKKLVDIPVVFVTAIKGDKDSRIRALESGAEAFLSKPIDETELMAQIRAMVKIKTAAVEKRDEKKRLEKLVEERTESLRKELKERKKAEEALRESEERFRNVLQDINSIAVQGYAPNGTTLYWNKASELFYGFTAEEAIGRNLLDLIIPSDMRDNVSEAIKWMAETSQPIPSAELSLQRKDGSRISVYSCHTIVQNLVHGKELFCLDIDITAQKQAEEDLKKAKEKAEESDRLKSAFLANMSHEIRTPMNGILGFAELLKEPGLTGEEQQKYVGIIEKSGARMLNIINDIIDISKIESGLMKLDIKETNINLQIEYIYTFFKPEVEAKGIKLSYKNALPGKEAIIKTDHEKFYAILTNLVKNAIKYSEKGAIELGYERKGKDIEFFVKDTGIGIPKDRQEAIFERFIQADIADKMARQGAGLGLAISKAYVEMLGGKIWVESEEGVGSAFYFTLPYNAEQEEKKAIEIDIPEQEEKEKIKKLKTLIAEDDETSEMLITIGVEKYCKEIMKARNGIEAVEVCRNNPDIDLILMDIQMPVMNGYEATRQIREFNKGSVIIAQTAFGLTGDREKVIEAGCNDYIAKPIKKAELQKLIFKYFGK